MRQRVLIITYYWPPAGGPGVQRWLKFVKYLREFNIEPIVYHPENPHYSITDTSLLSEIPEGITYITQKITEPYRWAGWFSETDTKRISSGIIKTEKQSLREKILLWIRGNFFIPDARKSWVEPSIGFLSEYIREEEIGTVITTGPPHSMHLIGLGLKEQLGIKWVADFRDPWTSIGYHKKLKLTKASQEKHKALESAVLNEADKIIVTGPTTKSEFGHITPKPIKVITNGHDSNYRGGANLDDKFSIAHIGSLLTDRNPKNLWKVLSDLAAENEIFRAELQLEFIGVVSKEVMDTLYRHELGPYLKLTGYVSHAQALRRQQRSQVLLLVEINSEDTKGIVPGKLFEYMAAKRPILAVGPEHWDAGKIINETRTGEVFDYNAQSELKNVILNWFQQFQEGKLGVHEGNIDTYSRRELTGVLASLLQWE